MSKVKQQVRGGQISGSQSDCSLQRPGWAVAERLWQTEGAGGGGPDAPGMTWKAEPKAGGRLRGPGDCSAPGPAWASALPAPTHACPQGALVSSQPYPELWQLRGLLLSVRDCGPTVPDGAFLPRGCPPSETDCPWSPVPHRVTMALRRSNLPKQPA